MQTIGRYNSRLLTILEALEISFYKLSRKVL